MAKKISDITEEDKSFIERHMTSFRIRECLNPECENAVIGHRCSGFCSIECMDRYLDINRKNKEITREKAKDSKSKRMIKFVEKMREEDEIGNHRKSR